MPIQKQHRQLYPFDWRQLSDAVRFRRAGGRCESCGRPHGKLVYHLGDGRWWDDEQCVWRNGRGRALKSMSPLSSSVSPAHITRVILATAHLDHDPTNNRPRNLRAFCQRCHLLNDRPEHQRRRLKTLRARKALGDLFLGLY